MKWSFEGSGVAIGSCNGACGEWNMNKDVNGGRSWS